MSDQQPDTNLIERLRDRTRFLEVDMAMARARYEEARDTLALAEGRRRPRRVLEALATPQPPDDAA